MCVFCFGVYVIYLTHTSSFRKSEFQRNDRHRIDTGCESFHLTKVLHLMFPFGQALCAGKANMRQNLKIIMLSMSVGATEKKVQTQLFSNGNWKEFKWVSSIIRQESGTMHRCCVSPTFDLMFRSRSIKFAVCQPPWNRVVTAKERFNAKNCCDYWSMCNQFFSLLLLLPLICMIWLWLLLVKHTPLHWFTKLIRFDAFICFMHLHGLAFHVEYIWRCMRAPTHDSFETKAKQSEAVEEDCETLL